MGNATPDGAGEPAFDLFDRWLAHREQESSDMAGDRQEPDVLPPQENPIFHETLVELDLPVAEPLPDGSGLDLVPAPESAPPAAAPLLTEAPLSGAPLTDTPLSVAAVTELPEPVALEAPTSPTIDPPVLPRPENEAARAVFAAFAASRPSPVTPPRTGPDVALAERGAAAVTRTAPDRGPVVAERVPAAVVPTSSRPVTTVAPVTAPLVAPVVTPVVGTREPAVPMIVEFAPRTRVRRLVGLLLLAALAATALAAYDAWQGRTSTSIGVAATLGVLTAIIWAARAGSAVARLTVSGGQLEIMRGGSRHRFDLASSYAPIEVVGEPGSRGWKVLIARRGMAPYVIDSSMVDPTEFMRVLRHYRPA
jgi:hypothetical protein